MELVVNRWFGRGVTRGMGKAWPRPLVTWPGGGPPLGALLASGVFRRKRFLGIFLEFSEHFDFSLFSAIHRQKLALGTRLIG